MTRIKLEAQQFPEEALQAVQQVLQPALENFGFFPGWLKDLTIAYSERPQSEDMTAHVEVSYNYRHATIFLTGHWLEEDTEGRVDIVLHELAHVFLQPLFSAWQKIAVQLNETAGAHTANLANSMMSGAAEGVVCDLAGALRGFIPLGEEEWVDMR